MAATITWNHYVEGVLADPDSAPTFVVTRTDTDEVVVNGTAGTKQSTGVYTLTFDEPAAGLTYSVVPTVDGDECPAFEFEAGTGDGGGSGGTSNVFLLE